MANQKAESEFFHCYTTLWILNGEDGVLHSIFISNVPSLSWLHSMFRLSPQRLLEAALDLAAL